VNLRTAGGTVVRALSSVVTGSRAGTLVPVAVTATVSIKNGAPS